MRNTLNDLISKTPDFFRWVFALPVSIGAMCIAQAVATLIIKIFFNFNKFQIFNLSPNEINYFLINFLAAYVFLRFFYYVIPKYKFKSTLILALT